MKLILSVRLSYLHSTGHLDRNPKISLMCCAVDAQGPNICCFQCQSLCTQVQLPEGGSKWKTEICKSSHSWQNQIYIWRLWVSRMKPLYCKRNVIPPSGSQYASNVGFTASLWHQFMCSSIVVWGIASLLSKEQGLKAQVSVVYCSSDIKCAQDTKALVSRVMLCFLWGQWGTGEG